MYSKLEWPCVISFVFLPCDLKVLYGTCYTLVHALTEISCTAVELLLYSPMVETPKGWILSLVDCVVFSSNFFFGIYKVHLYIDLSIYLTIETN